MSERLGVRSQGSDTKSKGRIQSPKGVGQIPKACASSRRPDMKGFGTQLGGGQGLTGAAWNRLGIYERVQDNVHERAHSPEGVRRPEMDVCARIHRVGASLWG